MEVEIQGLVKLPDFNGLIGTVQNFDAVAGRYDVLLDAQSAACGWRWVKVKKENLIVHPPKVRTAPTLLLDSCIPTGQDGSEAATPSPVLPNLPSTPKWEDDY